MDRRKIRTYPPIIVSVIVAAIVTMTAFAAVNNSLPEQPEYGVQQESGEEKVAEAQPATMIATTTAIESEETAEKYESMIHSRDWDAEESEILMKIAMAEAESEGVEGKALVMLVVLNRVWCDDFPGTIEEVVFQPKQFSPVTEGGRYYTTEPDEECREALELVMSGWDESYGALYFESCRNESWHSEHLEFLYQYGNHKFYR